MIYILVFIALLLRVVSIPYGLPHSLGDFDEVFAARNAIGFGATKSLHPVIFHYPAFYSYILFFLYGVYFFIGFISGRFHNVAEFAFAYLTAPGNFCAIGRIVSVISGTAAVLLVYIISKRFFKPHTSYAACALLTFSYLHTSMSWWAKPDIMMTSLSTAAFLFIFLISDTGRIKNYLLAGLFTGLAIASKYNAGLLLIPLLAAHLFSKSPPRRLLIAFLFLFLGVFLGAPYTFLDFPAFLKDFSSISQMVKVGEAGNVGRYPYLWLLTSIIKSDGLIGVIFIAGVVYSLSKPNKNKWLLLAFVVPVFLYTGLWVKNSLHYLLAIFPAIAILGGAFLAEVFRKTRALILAVGIIMLPSAAKIISADYKMLHKDTRIIAKDWIEENLSSGSSIALETIRYRDHPPIISYGTEFSSLDYGPKGRKAFSDPRLERLLEGYFKSNKTYRIEPIQRKRTDGEIDALIPSEYRNDSYIRDSCRYGWKRIEDMKQEGIEYIILSSNVYKKFTDMPLPPEGHPLFKVAREGRDYFESFARSSQVALIKEFIPDKNYGPVLKIYRIK